MQAFGAPAIAILIFAVILIFTMVKSVPQGENWTVERFGRYTRTLDPGLRFLVPLMDRVGSKINMMETVLDIEQQEVITRDNAMVVADAIAFYQVVEASRAAYEVRDLEQALKNISQTNIRAVLGSMDLDEALSNRDAINTRLLSVIDAASTPWGVKVTRVEIRDLAPPPDISEAMGRQMKAERLKRAEILTAEGLKQAAILKAEGEREAQIREAEGRRQAAFLDAEARERSAEAEAKATAMVSEAIARGDIQAINYFVAQKYTEALRELAASPNAKTIMVPLGGGEPDRLGRRHRRADRRRPAAPGRLSHGGARGHLALVVGGARHPPGGDRDADRHHAAGLVGDGGGADRGGALALAGARLGGAGRALRRALDRADLRRPRAGRALRRRGGRPGRAQPPRRGARRARGGGDRLRRPRGPGDGRRGAVAGAARGRRPRPRPRRPGAGGRRGRDRGAGAPRRPGAAAGHAPRVRGARDAGQRRDRPSAAEGFRASAPRSRFAETANATAPSAAAKSRSSSRAARCSRR